MYSTRFARPIILTLHARARMNHRGLDEALILELVETGEVRYKDATHIWIARHFTGRDDNLGCMAAVLEDSARKPQLKAFVAIYQHVAFHL